jgi:non-ribosomal peptide synthetase component F
VTVSLAQLAGDLVPSAHQAKVSRTELTPLSFLRRSAAVFPGKTAVVHGNRGTSYNYRTMAERVDRLASALQAAGLCKHDRVAFLCPNIPPMVEAHFAVPAAGGILVTINTRLHAEEVGYIVRHSGARFLFVDGTLQGLTGPLDRFAVTVIPIADTGISGDPYEDFLASGSPDPSAPSLGNEEETISINYTSGTTGLPPRPRQCHRNGADWGERLPVDGADVSRQWLGLCLGSSGGGRHSGLPAKGRAGPNLGVDRRLWGHPLQRRAHHPHHYRRPRSRAPISPPYHRRHWWSAAISHPLRTAA